MRSSLASSPVHGTTTCPAVFCCFLCGQSGRHEIVQTKRAKPLAAGYETVNYASFEGMYAVLFEPWLGKYDQLTDVLDDFREAMKLPP
jgi:hypothetical protein